MPWNGSGVAQVTDGTFTGTAIWTAEKNAANLVTAAHFDSFSADLCNMFQNCQTIDGQTVANIIKLVATTNSATGVITIGGVNFANMSNTNVFVGGAGNFNVTNSNVGLGINALSAVNADRNTAIGQQSGAAVTSGQLNTSLGFRSLQTETTGASNVVVGANAINLSNGASNNVAIGAASGQSITTGGHNTVLGQGCDVVAGGSSGQINLNCTLFGTGCITTGAAAGTGKLGVNNPAPTYAFDVLTGDLGIGTVGKGFRVNEAANGKQGTATLVLGTVTVANTNITANSRIFVHGLALNASTALGTLSVPTITAATSFVITSFIPGGIATQTGDLRKVCYEIFEPY